MEPEQFDRVFATLTERRKEVLTLFLSGEEDERIAESLHITKNTVRQHIRNLCIDFGLTDEFESDKAAKRDKLVALFAKHKPELVAPQTAGEEDRAELESDEETTSNPNFVGREQAIMDIDNRVRQGARCICILSPGGVGKTVLAEQYLQQRFQTIVRFDIAKERQNVSSAESLVEEKLRSLGEEPGREFLVSLARLRAKLESDKIGILVDNLEPALSEGGRFIENYRSYVELLRVLSSSSVRSLTLITSRETVAENLDIEVYPLARLSLEAWQEYFQQKAIATETPVLGEIHRAYQGNALAMKILRSRIFSDYNNDLADYWTLHQTQEGVVVEQAIDNLIIEQFDRLQNISPTTYQLLYRMGCFRFQDVPTVPREGLLCLLWDVPKNVGVKAIRDLCDRGLVERVNREYKLHPLIRQEAVKRLQESEDWERANRSAAEFWTDWIELIETVVDANTALESYYHYLVIKDYEKCARVICKRRTYQWSKTLIKDTPRSTLGGSFIRLGIYEQISRAIHHILFRIPDNYFSSKLHNCLGDIYWITGNVDLAIESHIRSGKIARQSLEYLQESKPNSFNGELNGYYWIELKVLAIVHFYNIAICKIDKGEFDSGIEYIQQVIIQAEKSDLLFGYYIRALANLASLSAFLGNLEDAENLASKLEKMSHIKLGVRSTAYRSYHLGQVFQYLSDFQKSLYYYQQSQEYCQKINFSQGQGVTLTGISELYRLKNEYEIALLYHAQSINILEKLGAKCDLAEAYYQLGLTYKQTGDIAQSQDYFNHAIALWEKINAPKQIARVRESMNS